MKNISILNQKIEDSLNYLYANDERLKPVLDYLTEHIRENIKSESLTVKEAFEMWLAIQEQYTNSVLLQTKLKEILDFRDFIP